MKVEDIKFVSIRDEQSFFQRAAHCVSTVLDGETVILDVESGLYSGLNEVGSVVWDLLEDQVTLAELHEAILKDFDVTSEVCDAHLVSFLQELMDNKLIKVAGGTDT